MCIGVRTDLPATSDEDVQQTGAVYITAICVDPRCRPSRLKQRVSCERADLARHAIQRHIATGKSSLRYDIPAATSTAMQHSRETVRRAIQRAALYVSYVRIGDGHGETFRDLQKLGQGIARGGYEALRNGLE
jgi:hypothetical protein